MTTESTVGARLAAIFRPVDDRPAEPVVEPVVPRSMSDGLRPVEPEPELPAEIAERIRAGLRAGDWQAAAELAGKVLNSLGIDSAPELLTRAQPSADSDRSGRATDARDDVERAGAAAARLPRTTLPKTTPAGPAVAARSRWRGSSELLTSRLSRSSRTGAEHESNRPIARRGDRSGISVSNEQE
jgi:hypothetical protein